MRASTIIRKLLRRGIAQVFDAYVATMFLAIDALVRGGRATLTELGRSLDAPTTPKHRIKRIDRLLGNVRLQGRVLDWYKMLTARLLGGIKRPIILLDWTELPSGLASLTAAVPVDGRSVPIYNQVHRFSGNGSAHQIQRFISVLHRLLPDGVKPTLVADAGFTLSLIRACMRREFDLVVRIRPGALLRSWNPEQIVGAGALAAAARRRAESVGHWCVYDSARKGEILRVVVAKRTGRYSHEFDSPYRKRALEPWVLATTREDLSPDEVIGVYALRMRIEETFRDAKNGRFGWSLAHTATRYVRRMQVLLLITSLAMLAVFLAGSAADAAGCTRFLQANTTRHRPVLSLFRIGCLILVGWQQLAKLARLRR